MTSYDQSLGIELRITLVTSSREMEFISLIPLLFKYQMVLLAHY